MHNSLSRRDRIVQRERHVRINFRKLQQIENTAGFSAKRWTEVFRYVRRAMAVEVAR